MELFIFFILVLAVALGFFIQVVFGFAGSLVAIPILLLVMPLQEAVALTGLLLFAFSLITVPKYWKDIDKHIVLELSVGTVLGMPIGIYWLRFANPLLLQKGLGALIIVYIIHHYWKQRKVKFFAKLGLFFGTVGGVLSGLYNTGGSILVTYITNRLHRPRAIRATLIGVLAVRNFVRIPLLYANGMFTDDLFSKALAALPFFLLALYFGHRVYPKLKANIYMHALMGLLFLSAISLILK